MKAWWMEEHHEAYLHWRDQGYRQMACVHVDAHLDVRDDGDLPHLARCATRAERERHLGSGYLPWTGLHCGNYLTPALNEGLVAHLVWVVPDPLWEEAWAWQQVGEWIDLTVEESLSLRWVEGRLEGRLRGARLTLCRADGLPVLEHPALLDVDVDYFLHQGELWDTPAQLHARLPPHPWEALTVALSVRGGYTPNALRYLGEEVMQLFAGQTVSCAGEARHLDRGSELFRLGRIPEALAELERGEEPLLRAYLLGTVHARAGAPGRAAACFKGLEATPGLPPHARGFLAWNHGSALQAAGRSDEALPRLARAVGLWPRAEAIRDYAACLRHLGQCAQAERWLKAGRRLLEGRMSAATLVPESLPPAPA